MVVNRRHLYPLFLLLSLCFSLWSPTVQAQPGTPAQSLTPGPKPADAPLEWKQLVGVYGHRPSIIILERSGKLLYRDSAGAEYPIHQLEGPIFEVTLRDSHKIGIGLPLNHTFGPIPSIAIEHKTYERADAAGEGFYHVTPTRPVEELRKAALTAEPPEEPGPFRKPDLVELTTLDPAIHLDIRYAQSNNFLSTPVYTQARAFVQRPAAEALLRVLRKLQPLGYGLLIHDAYRPWYVTKIFWDATPPEGKIFVADPRQGSRHNRGCALDLTLYEMATGQPVEMPGLYDEMSPRSFPNFPGGTSLQRWHRDLLRRAMESEGFTVFDDEWWHFDYKDWNHYAILNVPFEKLSPESLKPN